MKQSEIVNYTQKSYGRNEEVANIFRQFNAGVDLSMPGPRRLGKTFVLERLVDAGPSLHWNVVKVEVAGCTDTSGFFRQFCLKIANERQWPSRSFNWFLQRLGQAIDPRTASTGNWYQAFISLDYETYFERLIKVLNDDKDCKWALLIDELPIFLNALHDQGSQGVIAARNFMNQISRLRVDCPNVRWLITGSIGLEPLAQTGNYMGVLAKFQPYYLETLTHEQARDFVIDLALIGKLMHRTQITSVEADAIVHATGWRSAFYLEAVAKKLSGSPTEDVKKAHEMTEDAIEKLLNPMELATFGVWEEHLKKHYDTSSRTLALAMLGALAKNPQGLGINALLTAVAQPEITAEKLREALVRLDVDGFISVDTWGASDPLATFRNVLLRRWWLRFPPSSAK